MVPWEKENGIGVVGGKELTAWVGQSWRQVGKGPWRKEKEKGRGINGLGRGRVGDRW